MRAILLLALAGMAWGQAEARDHSLAYSQLAFASAATADVLSSFGGNEVNPVVGRGPFGARQAAVSLGITGVWLLAQRPIVKHWPETRKVLEWFNFGGAALHTGVAIHNWRE